MKKKGEEYYLVFCDGYYVDYIHELSVENVVLGHLFREDVETIRINKRKRRIDVTTRKTYAPTLV